MRSVRRGRRRRSFNLWTWLTHYARLDFILEVKRCSRTSRRFHERSPLCTSRSRTLSPCPRPAPRTPLAPRSYSGSLVFVVFVWLVVVLRAVCCVVLCVVLTPVQLESTRWERQRYWPCWPAVLLYLCNVHEGCGYWTTGRLMDRHRQFSYNPTYLQTPKQTPNTKHAVSEWWHLRTSTSTLVTQYFAVVLG